VSAVFSIRGGSIAKLLLDLDDVLDVLVLDGDQVRLRNLSLLEGRLRLQEFLRSEKRAKVLSTEGRVAVKMVGHGQ